MVQLLAPLRTYLQGKKDVASSEGGTPVQNGCCLWVRALTRPEKGAFLPLRLLNWGARPYSQARAPLGERRRRGDGAPPLISCVVSTLVLGWSAGQAIDEEAEWTRETIEEPTCHCGAPSFASVEHLNELESGVRRRGSPGHDDTGAASRSSGVCHSHTNSTIASSLSYITSSIEENKRP